MPFASNAGVRICYECEGDGPPLVLVHGLTETMEAWREFGYVEPLREHNRLVLIDMRGHGRSDKPHDELQYSPAHFAGDVVAVLDDLGIERTHLYGHSMGGRVALCTAKHAPHRLQSVAVGAALPYSNPERNRAFLGAFDLGIDEFVAIFESQAPMSPAMRARIAANDLAALQALIRYRANHVDDTEDALPALSVPYRLIVGDADAQAPLDDVLRFAATLAPGALVTLPGANHLQSFQQADLVLPHLRELIAAAS